MKHTPATPLPWAVLPYKNGGRDREHIAIDDAFELHACNAYLRLVNECVVAIKRTGWSEGHPMFNLLRELGEL